MKRLLVPCATLACAILAGTAAAQVPGQLGGATPLAVNSHVFGAYAAVGSGQSALHGQLRLSFYPGVDFGFFGGLHRIDRSGTGRTAVEMGADVRGLVAKRGDTSPVDLALGGVVGVSSADHFSMMSVGPTVVASRTSPLHDNTSITPYAGAALLYSRSSVGDQNSTDLSLPLRFGVEYRPNTDLRLVGELQVPLSDAMSRSAKLVIGANFPF